MSLYADQPARRSRQVAGDLLVLVWVLGWALVGVAVHDGVAQLAAPGRTLEDAGSALGTGLGDVGEGLGDVPLLGDGLAEPFVTAGSAARSLEQAGADLQDGVARAATVSGWAVALWPALGALGAWTVVRTRFARRSAAVRRLAATAAGTDLLALRALATRSPAELARTGADPAGAWRRGDPAVVLALADLELAGHGVVRRPG